MKQKISIIIGRFQPGHIGHLELIETALNGFDLLIIFVGHCKLFNNRHILSQKQVIDSLNIELKNYENIVILPLNDNPSDMSWIDSIKLKVSAFIKTTDYEITFFGNRKENWYNIIFPVRWNIYLIKHSIINATNIRNKLTKGIISSNILKSFKHHL